MKVTVKMRRDVIEFLKAQGYNVSDEPNMKNGVAQFGIVFRDTRLLRDNPRISPIIYLEDLAQPLDTAETLAQRVIIAYKATTGFKPNSQIVQSWLSDPDFIKGHLRLSLERDTFIPVSLTAPSSLDGLRKNLLLFMTLPQDENTGVNSSIMVTERLLSLSGISIEDAWACAEKNTADNTCIKTIAQVLSHALGIPEEFIASQIGPNMFVVTNDEAYRGAGSIFAPQVKEYFKKAFPTNTLVALPASIHEWVVVPIDDTYDMDETIARLSGLVDIVNSKEVDPREQLGDRAYVLNL